MQIVLCDDEPEYHKIMKDLISQYKQARPDRSLTLSFFSSGKELLNHVDEHGAFDLYILDVIMPGMNGIELGAALRYRDDAGTIIYLTTSLDFALDSYKVEALNYLLKPVDTEQLFRCLDKAYQAFSRIRQEVISVKTPASIRLISASDIRYAERTGKQICYYMTDETVIRSASFNGSFQNAVADLLEHKGMILVGSSFVVNLSHVIEITRSDLILTGNLQVPVPRRLYDKIKREWGEFWLNGGRYHAF